MCFLEIFFFNFFIFSLGVRSLNSAPLCRVGRLSDCKFFCLSSFIPFFIPVWSVAPPPSMCTNLIEPVVLTNTSLLMNKAACPSASSSFSLHRIFIFPAVQPKEHYMSDQCERAGATNAGVLDMFKYYSYNTKKISRCILVTVTSFKNINVFKQSRNRKVALSRSRH